MTVIDPAAPALVALDLGGQVVAVEPRAHGAATWLGLRLASATRDHGIPVEVAQGARRVVEAAAHGSGVARELLEVPGIGAVELVAMAVMGVRRTSADVRQTLASALAPIERQAHARDVELTLHVDADVPAQIPMDAEKIAWAVATLAGNALRYVRCGGRSLPGGCVHVKARRDHASEQLVIAVEDDGEGIAPEVLERLVTAEPDLRGALALRVARDVLRAQGGSLTIESSTTGDEPGTTVTLRLPLGAARSSI